MAKQTERSQKSEGDAGLSLEDVLDAIVAGNPGAYGAVLVVFSERGVHITLHDVDNETARDALCLGIHHTLSGNFAEPTDAVN